MREGHPRPSGIPLGLRLELCLNAHDIPAKSFDLSILRIDAPSLNSATIIVTSFSPPLTKRRSAYMHSAAPNK